MLLTRDTTGSQRGARWTPNSTGGLISVFPCPERKQTTQRREGSRTTRNRPYPVLKCSRRDGRTASRHHTAHRDFTERTRCVASRRPPGLGRLPLPISLRSPSPILAATFMPPRGRPTLVVLPPVNSSSVASLSSTSSCCAAAARRSLALSRLLLPAQLRPPRGVFWRPRVYQALLAARARTTLLTRPPQSHLPPSHIVA